MLPTPGSCSSSLCACSLWQEGGPTLVPGVDGVEAVTQVLRSSGPRWCQLALMPAGSNITPSWLLLA